MAQAAASAIEREPPESAARTGVDGDGPPPGWALGAAAREPFRLRQQMGEGKRAGSLTLQKNEQILGRARLAEELPLTVVAVVFAQEVQMPHGLDALGDHFHAEAPPISMMVRTMVASPASSLTSRTKDWSILSVPMGNCCSAESEE
jgi:hypothetical protein